jgi:hypothetical protein
MVLKSRLPPVDWSADGDPDREALCRKFPLPDDNDVSKDPWFHDMEEAALICNGTYSGVVCPFRSRCLHRALVNNEGSGVFGGLLPIQRKWVRKNVPKVDWEYPDEWLETVPPLEFFEESDDLADAEEDDED